MKNLPPGWLTADEADELRRLAAGQVVLELGAWKGRSTAVLAEVAAYVVSVDRHQGIPGQDGDSLPEYLEHVRALPNVAIVVADFERFVPLLTHRGVGLVYIDGDHDAQAVRRDIDLALTLWPRTIAFHDWDFPDVRETAEGVLGDPDALAGSIASYGMS